MDFHISYRSISRFKPKGKKLLVIRLSRKGRRNFPMYRLQVAENSMPTDGKFVEIVGNYNPTAADQPFEVKKDRVEYWISKGAQPSNTVAKLLNKVGFNLPVEQGNKAPKKKAKAKLEEANKPALAVSSAPETASEEPVAEESVSVDETVLVAEEKTEDSGLPVPGDGQGEGVAPDLQSGEHQDSEKASQNDEVEASVDNNPETEAPKE
ncbi:MAG: 30S ribosomal protein S16 [Patescibacteria group bacterium]